MLWTQRFFALLDVICLILLAQQAYTQYQSLLSNEVLTSLEFFSRTLFLLGWCSLIFSAILLAIPKKAGLWLYYAQLPLRLVFFIFSFGFISLLTYIINWQIIINMLMPLIVFGELLRLYYSVQIHKVYYK
ncbi:hypothetical protein [Pedobacter puniceum]|jgi:hypothetical protein|uniref:Uncharacterized protein n=1 Tax=Pedobacter puniceum TaxID=2666136 RepID=A0A7K0FNN7_9SPHI|nr:hypothetical protein [Pedobacter puniceum]MRX47604.1 hypothetical protein [Pedobacter puniceum]